MSQDQDQMLSINKPSVKTVKTLNFHIRQPLIQSSVKYSPLTMIDSCTNYRVHRPTLNRPVLLNISSFNCVETSQPASLNSSSIGYVATSQPASLSSSSVSCVETSQPVSTNSPSHSDTNRVNTCKLTSSAEDQNQIPVGCCPNSNNVYNVVS